MSTRSEATPSFSAPGESRDLLPALRDLYSRHPEMHDLAPWELQSALFVLGYVDGLADEAEIAAAVELARTDRLRALDQLLLRRFQGKVGRGLALALDLSRRHGARGRAQSLPDTATEPKKGAA